MLSSSSVKIKQKQTECKHKITFHIILLVLKYALHCVFMIITLTKPWFPEIICHFLYRFKVNETLQTERKIYISNEIQSKIEEE